MIPWKYIIAINFIGLLMIVGFFSAARLHFQSLDFGITALKNMKAYQVLKDEERRLLFISETAKAKTLGSETKLQNTVEDQLSIVKFDLQTLHLDAENKKILAEEYDKDAKKIIIYCFAVIIVAVIFLSLVGYYKKESAIFNQPLSLKLLQISNFLFSNKNQKELFEPIISDWQEEYFDALFNKEIWKARGINVRYTYAFLVAMWQKSPIGDLIEFVSKLAK